MTTQEQPNRGEDLVGDIIQLIPELDQFYRPDGEVRQEVGTFIAAVFGKYWYATIQHFEFAGRCRDLEIDVRRSIDPAHQKQISNLLSGLFDKDLDL